MLGGEECGGDVFFTKHYIRGYAQTTVTYHVVIKLFLKYLFIDFSLP